MKKHLFKTCILFIATGMGAPAQLPLHYFGENSCSGNFRPTFHTEGEFPWIGNYNFKLVVRNLEGKAPGVFFMSSYSPFPPQIFSVSLPCPPVSGSFGIPGVGQTSYPLPIPYNPNLIGMRIFLQGVFATNLKSPKVSLVFTRGVAMDIVKNFPKELEVIFEIKKYQAYFKGSTATQADRKGKLIWNAINNSNFVYIKTKHYSSGGQDNWIILVKDKKYMVEFALIPGGSYQMGDLNKAGYPRESPVHWVRINPFLMARTEVTQGQWKAVVGTTPWMVNPSTPKPYVYSGPNSSGYSANYISWRNAVAFCNKTGWRLPSESEWEYACRAGTTSKYFFGNDTKDLGKYAWYASDPFKFTPQQAGAKLPNAFGLRDIHGNVWEWCGDPAHDSYYCATTDGKYWNTGISLYKIYRGGATVPSHCRSAYRGNNFPDFQSNFTGLRPVVSLF